MDPMMEPLTRHDTYGRTPEARVLIIMTGGTICMQKSSDGLVPVRGFLETCMAPRLEFNDQIEHEAIDVCVAEAVTKKMKSLRTPKSTYGKRVRYVLSLKSTPSSLLLPLGFSSTEFLALASLTQMAALRILLPGPLTQSALILCTILSKAIGSLLAPG